MSGTASGAAVVVGTILVVLGLFTVVMGYYASQLRMDAGFAKQLPRDHEYIETFFEYQDQLVGANRVIVVLRARQGDIWNQPFLAKLRELTDDLFFLPGIDHLAFDSRHHVDASAADLIFGRLSGGYCVGIQTVGVIHNQAFIV